MAQERTWRTETARIAPLNTTLLWQDDITGYDVKSKINLITRFDVIIKPKVRGFICTTTHPVGCEQNVREQIEATRARGLDKQAGPKKCS